MPAEAVEVRQPVADRHQRQRGHRAVEQHRQHDRREQAEDHPRGRRPRAQAEALRPDREHGQEHGVGEPEPRRRLGVPAPGRQLERQLRRAARRAVHEPRGGPVGHAPGVDDRHEHRHRERHGGRRQRAADEDAEGAGGERLEGRGARAGVGGVEARDEHRAAGEQQDDREQVVAGARQRQHDRRDEPDADAAGDEDRRVAAAEVRQVGGDQEVGERGQRHPQEGQRAAGRPRARQRCTRAARTA